ncbi:hypothetical protein [Flavobacterium ustbae]|uniref:hypothetical protein n=1 Tax=Flavobacterium ustbae TaxID=2488790 RepID=UPI000F771DBA|nr:hypothetical protein [Flavobacterium ustbae]
MKNKLFLFSILILGTFASCSSDENSYDKEDTSVLPKTMSYNYPDFPEDNTKITITYAGNKIVSSVEDDSKTVFTYDGNMITKQIQYDIEGGKEIKDTEVSYSYENGKLKTRIIRELFSEDYPEGQYIYKTVYTHVSEAVITYVNYSINSDTKVETKSTDGTLTYNKGNLVKNELSGSPKSDRVYEYDAKNNPLKNILGFDLLLNEVSDYAKNNVTKETKSDNGTNVASYLTTYTYNEKGYPIKNTSFTSDGKTVEYEIEYTY